MATRQDGKGVRMPILNVDDNAAIRYARSRILRRAGFDVREAPTGDAALKAALDDRPQLVLLDVNLPDISGLEVCRQIKSNPTTSAITVLHVSATARTDSEQYKALENGADGYLVEPVAPELLISTIRAFMRVRMAEAEQARLVEELKRANGELRGVLESITDGFLSFDRNWRVLEANQRGHEYLEMSAAQLVGRSLWDIFPNVVDGTLDQHCQKALETGEKVHFEAQSPSTGRWFEAHVHPADERVSVFFREVTERKQSERRVRELYDSARQEIELRRQMEARLRASNEGLERFAYAISHDLKEPLRSALSFSQLLARRYHGQLGAEADELISHIEEPVRRMARMIDDLLNYSQLMHENGTEFGQMQMSATLDWALQNLEETIRDAGAEIRRSDLPTVKGDFGLLGQLWQNLVGNAIKYRSEAPPRIEIEAISQGAEWCFSVRDNGIGLDPGFREHIFQAFKRLHGREYPGTGLGLAISRRIVEQHRGRIWVDSEPGKGSTFYFTLPK